MNNLLRLGVGLVVFLVAVVGLLGYLGARKDMEQMKRWME